MTDNELEIWRRKQLKAIRAHLRTLSKQSLLASLEDVAAQVVIACGDVGATDWPPQLYLADVIEKHLMRSVQPYEPPALLADAT